MKYLKTYQTLFESRRVVHCCYGEGLTKLDNLPDNLTLLDCSDNNLTSLPELPKTLIKLDCSNNKLTELPKLPDSLSFLNCEYNKLTELPKLPETLCELKCDFNNWKEPFKKEFKEKWDIQYNQLTFDFMKYEFQKEYLTKYPDRIIDFIDNKMEKSGFRLALHPDIKIEFDYLLNELF